MKRSVIFYPYITIYVSWLNSPYSGSIRNWWYRDCLRALVHSNKKCSHLDRQTDRHKLWFYRSPMTMNRDPQLNNLSTLLPSFDIALLFCGSPKFHFSIPLHSPDWSFDSRWNSNLCLRHWIFNSTQNYNFEWRWNISPVSTWLDVEQIAKEMVFLTMHFFIVP